MKSSSIKEFGIIIHFERDGKKVYRVAETESGFPMSKCYVFGIGKKPYVKAYNRKSYLLSDELALLAEII